MTPAACERLHVRVPILLISAAAWVLLSVERDGTRLAAHCALPMLGAMSSSPSLDAVIAFNPNAWLTVGWALMLTAMMGPLLIAPVRHVHDRSFASRRARAIVLFLAGYAAIWIAAGVIFLTVALLVRLVAPESWITALVVVAALVWQLSPAKQACLNRGHAHPELAAFGPAANVDALRFGITHGVWCIGSCWALMLLPFLISRGHVAAMAAVTLWIFGERLETPKPPNWELRSPSKAARIAAAQTRMWLQR